MQQKLSELFVQQYQALLAVAFQLARNEDDALDLMQDLAETIARNDRPASSVEHPMAFFRTCLRNARINSLKKAQREIPSEPETFAQIPAEESVEQDVVGSAAMAWLKQELASYPPEMREAFYLYYFDGYSLDEVSKKLNINKKHAQPAVCPHSYQIGKKSSGSVPVLRAAGVVPIETEVMLHERAKSKSLYSQTALSDRPVV